MIDQSQVRELFPDSDVLVVPPTALPNRSINSSLRELLTVTGVPDSFIGVVIFDDRIAKKVPTVGEVYQDYGEQPPGDAADYLYLGVAGDRFMCVDGSGGTLCQVAQEFGIRPLNSGLEEFIRVLGFVSREAYEYWGGELGIDASEFSARLRERTIQYLRRVDSAVPSEGETAWRDLLDSIVYAAT